MKKSLSIICLCLCIIACNNDDDGGGSDEPEVAQRTVLAYLIGDNNGSELTSYLRNDFMEMCQGMADVDVTQNKLLVYSQSENDFPRLIHIKKNKGKIVADTIYTYPLQNPLEQDIMTSVMQEVFNKFPAQSYGLILASHAEGWVQGSASASRWFGDYQGYYMDIQVLRDVLGDFPHFNFILFDACYMQTIEVAYELREFADYIIASPSEIPGPGAPFHTVVPKMFADKEDIAVDIAMEYFNYYDEIYQDTSEDWEYGVSISVVKTAELEELASMTKRILPQYITNGEYIDTSNLFYYDGYSKRYYYDFPQFIRYLTDQNSDYDDWYNVFSKACPYFKTTPTNFVGQKNDRNSDMSNAEGLSIYIPRGSDSFNSYYHTLSWYEDGGWADTGW